MNLHDWIDELCDVLDLETEVDEGLLGDLAELARENVDHAAGPVTTYLLGYAAGTTGAGPATLERLAAKAQDLAEAWDRPPGAPDKDDVPVIDDGSMAEISAIDIDDLTEDEDDEDADEKEEE